MPYLRVDQCCLSCRKMSSSRELKSRELSGSPWTDYIKRATKQAEDHLRRLQIDSWPTTYLRRKWRWAARVATQTHDRWPQLAAKWRPQLDHRLRSSRRQARPHKRWSDDFDKFLTAIYSNTSQQTPDWLALAATSQWQVLEDRFIDHSSALLTTQRQASRTPRPSSTTTTASAAKQ